MRISVRCLNVLNRAILFSHTLVAQKLRLGGRLGHQCLDCPTAFPVKLMTKIGQADFPFAIVADDVIVIRRTLDPQFSTGRWVRHHLSDACGNERSHDGGFRNSLYATSGMPVAPCKAYNGECKCTCSGTPKSVRVFFLHFMSFLDRRGGKTISSPRTNLYTCFPE